MICILLIHVFYCKVVNNKAKADRPGFVFPEAVNDLALVVSVFR